MKFRHWLSALTSAGLIAAAATVAFAQPLMLTKPAKIYPLQDFFRKPQQTSFRISPDGKTLGFMQPYESRLNVFVQPIDKVGTQDGVKRLTSETARDVSNFFSKARSMCCSARTSAATKIITW